MNTKRCSGDSVVDDFIRADQEIMSRASNYSNWILNRLVRPNLGQSVLEVGCGIGNYSAGILSDKKVRRITGIDLDPACAALCRDKLLALQGDKVATVVHANYLEIDLPAESFDTVVCLNVLEHLEDERIAVEKAYASLVPGGKFIVFVPAFPILAGTIDRRLGHYHRYTKETATELFSKAGFSIARMRYYNFTGFFGWFIRFRVLQKDHQDPSVVGAFDKYVFPVQSLVEERLPWLPIGQSLFVIARKPVELQ